MREVLTKQGSETGRFLSLLPATAASIGLLHQGLANGHLRDADAALIKDIQVSGTRKSRGTSGKRFKCLT